MGVVQVGVRLDELFSEERLQTRERLAEARPGQTGTPGYVAGVPVVWLVRQSYSTQHVDLVTIIFFRFLRSPVGVCAVI